MPARPTLVPWSRIAATISRACAIAVLSDGEDQDFLASVVERHILPGLEEAQLAHAFGGNAAGGKVGDAAGFEFEADVGDVNLAREYRQPDRPNFPDRRIRERQNDVEVVNHQVQHDVDIQRAWGEDAEAVNLEEHWLSQQGGGRAYSGVETLEMSGLGDEIAGGCQ